VPHDLDTLIIALDALSQRWHTVLSQETMLGGPLRNYLQLVFDVATKWTTHRFHSSGVNSQHLEPTRDTDWLVLKPSAIMAMMARYYWFHQTLDQLTWFGPSPKLELPVHYFDRFIHREKRHLKIRKFRDELAKAVWERMLLYGDREIITHEQMGDVPSAYSCLYKRHPVCLMQQYQRTLAYGTFEEICEHFEDILWLKLIQCHFINNYKLDFIKLFVCWESDQHKHKLALQRTQVPIILQRFNQFTLLHNGTTSPRGTLRDIFPQWVQAAQPGPHKCDISMLYTHLFSEVVVHVADDIDLVVL
jgi:hypothetical protein